MLKQRLKGLWQQLRGRTKSTYGDATGDRKAQLTGRADTAAGSIREGVGRAVDHVKHEARYGAPRPEDRL